MAWRDLFRLSWWRELETRWSGTAEQRAFDWSGSLFSRIPGPAEAGYAGSFATPDLRRAESALQSIAIWAAVGLKADLVSTLPLHVYRGEGAARRQLPTPALLDDPGGEGHGLEDWLTQFVFSDQLRGNVYGTVPERDSLGYPRQIVLYHPDEVQGWRSPTTGAIEWTVGGRSLPAGAQIWHRRGRTMPGQLLGLSPIALHATGIGQGLSAGRYGTQWFGEGAHPNGILSNDQAELSEGQAKMAKAKWIAATRGSREPMVLDMHWKWTPIQVTAEESQFLATQRYSEAQCARIFGPGLPEILGYETGGSLTYSTIEQRSQDLLTYTLDPLLVRLERIFTRMLAGGAYARFQRNALLRTDLMTRYSAYRTAIAAKFMTPDEVRGLEELAPLTAEQKDALAAITVAPAPDPTTKGGSQ